MRITNKELLASSWHSSLEQRENTIHPLCSDALINKNMAKINEVTETLVSSFVDNHEDFGELLVDDDDGELAVLIERKIKRCPRCLRRRNLLCHTAQG